MKEEENSGDDDYDNDAANDDGDCDDDGNNIERYVVAEQFMARLTCLSYRPVTNVAPYNIIIKWTFLTRTSTQSMLFARNH
jgi:hypothetical protein